MLKKILTTSVLLVTAYANSLGQNETEEQKIIYNFAGIQANELLRELMSFGGTRPDIDNPYFVVYSFNSTQSSWTGMNIGLGIQSFTTILDDDNAAVERETKVRRFDFRVGYDKKYFVGRKFMASLGIDALFSLGKDETISDDEFSPLSEIRTSHSGIGLGPRLTFSYFVTDKILLMTESTYYWRRVVSKEEIDVQGSSNDEQTAINRSFEFAPPVAIYLVFKF